MPAKTTSWSPAKAQEIVLSATRDQQAALSADIGGANRKHSLPRLIWHSRRSPIHQIELLRHKNNRAAVKGLNRLIPKAIKEGLERERWESGQCYFAREECTIRLPLSIQHRRGLAAMRRSLRNIGLGRQDIKKIAALEYWRRMLLEPCVEGKEFALMHLTEAMGDAIHLGPGWQAIDAYVRGHKVAPGSAAASSAPTPAGTEV